MKDILTDIVDTIQNKYNGLLDCEKQRADLFTYVDGVEETIQKVDTEYIYFNDRAKIKLIDSDIAILVYLKNVIVKRYKVEFNYVYGWDDVFFVDGINTNEEPTVFKSKKDAEECIKEHLNDLKNAIADGHMSTDSIQERDDYRIVEFKN
tara:strand:+ start:1581 stop:2030 length:450 start_codon:yes stop_codon:yes gene_type:complete